MAKTEETTPAAPKKANGIVNSDWIKGWKQVQPMSPRFQYRGDNYEFEKLTEQDLNRILSYHKNPWFIKLKEESK